MSAVAAHLTEGTTLISLPMLISYACRDAISFSLSLGPPRSSALPSSEGAKEKERERESSRERSRKWCSFVTFRIIRIMFRSSRLLASSRVRKEQNHGHNLKPDYNYPLRAQDNRNPRVGRARVFFRQLARDSETSAEEVEIETEVPRNVREDHTFLNPLTPPATLC